MKVDVDISRRDLLQLNLFMLPRCSANYVVWAFISALVFFFIVWGNGFPQTSGEWIAAILGTFLGGLGGTIVAIFISLVFVLVSSKSSNGVLGKHEYEIRPEGLYEITCANEGLSKWGGIQDVRMFGPYLLFRVSGYLFHVIPKRCFSAEESFHSFAGRSIALWNEAHNKSLNTDAGDAGAG